LLASKLFRDGHFTDAEFRLVKKEIFSQFVEQNDAAANAPGKAMRATPLQGADDASASKSESGKKVTFEHIISQLETCRQEDLLTEEEFAAAKKLLANCDDEQMRLFMKQLDGVCNLFRGKHFTAEEFAASKWGIFYTFKVKSSPVARDEEAAPVTVIPAPSADALRSRESMNVIRICTGVAAA
jgi:hypothetical protein